MTVESRHEELMARLRQLEHESEQRKRFELINTALFRIASAVNTTSNRNELFQAIHVALSPVLDTSNFFIAMYDKEHDRIFFPYIVDSVDEIYPEVLGVSKTASLTAEVIRTGEPLCIDKATALRMRQESGRSIPSCTLAEIWLGVPLRVRHGIIGVMAVQSYIDKTRYDRSDIEIMMAVADQVAIALDRKLKEEQLVASEARFRHIVDTANEGIVQVSADWRIVYTNSYFARLLGYEPAEILDRLLEELFWPDDLKSFQKQKEERSLGIHRNFERKFKTREGQCVETLVSASSILDGEGRFGGSFGMITDITVLKKTQAELQEKILELQKAAEQIRTLRGIVPICMHCKKVRDDQGFWNQVEVYVETHTGAEFSHGICPDCINTYHAKDLKI